MDKFKKGDIIVKKNRYDRLIDISDYPHRMKIERVNIHTYNISYENEKIKIENVSSITFIDSFYIKDISYYRDKKIEKILN